MDAVGAVGCTRPHLVQEHDLILPFLHPHGVAGEVFQLLRQLRQLVIMRGEQRAAAIDGVQMLDRRPGDGQPVIGRRAAADLIQDDQRARAGLVQDRRRLHHLHHEGGAPARQIVGGADAAEQPVHRADPRRLRRHEAADLRQDGDQRVLSQEGRFAGHVRAGQQPVPLLAFQHAIIADEAFARRLQRRFHHRMATAGDGELRTFRHFRADIAVVDGQLGQRRGHIQPGDGAGGQGDGVGMGRHLADQVAEQRQLHRQRLVGGAGEFLFQLAQFHRGETHRARHGLAMDEILVGQQLVAVIGRDLDEIAQHIVVLDLQAGNPGLLLVARLQPGDQPAALVAQGAQLVQLRRIARRDEAAIARQHRQIGRQRAGETVHQRAMPAKIVERLGDPLRQRRQRWCARQIAQHRTFRQRVADRRQVARAAPVQRQPCQRALDIRAALQRLAQLRAQ